MPTLDPRGFAHPDIDVAALLQAAISGANRKYASEQAAFGAVGQGLLSGADSLRQGLEAIAQREFAAKQADIGRRHDIDIEDIRRGRELTMAQQRAEADLTRALAVEKARQEGMLAREDIKAKGKAATERRKALQPFFPSGGGFGRNVGSIAPPNTRPPTFKETMAVREFGAKRSKEQDDLRMKANALDLANRRLAQQQSQSVRSEQTKMQQYQVRAMELVKKRADVELTRKVAGAGKFVDSLFKEIGVAEKALNAARKEKTRAIFGGEEAVAAAARALEAAEAAYSQAVSSWQDAQLQYRQMIGSDLGVDFTVNPPGGINVNLPPNAAPAAGPQGGEVDDILDSLGNGG